MVYNVLIVCCDIIQFRSNDINKNETSERQSNETSPIPDTVFKIDQGQ